MDIVNFKKNIFNNNKIEELLIKLGCHNVKKEQSGKIITAGLPGGDNRRSVQVKNNPYLDACIRSKGITGIDLFDVVSYVAFNETTLDGMSYNRTLAINWVKRNLDIELKDFSTTNLTWAEDISKPKNKPLNKQVLKQYIMLPHHSWIKEGISYETQTFFNIGYNLENNQIVIPIYNQDDELIGVKARNLDTHRYEYKYTYLYPCIASNNLYGLNIAKRHIKKVDMVILFESEKSVMKSFQYGYRCAVALGCSDLTQTQLNLLKEYLSPTIKIILAFDKDVYYKKGKFNFDHLKKIDSMFKQNTYAIIDKDGILGEKDAPIDCGKENFNKLLKQAALVINLKNDEEEV